MNNNILVSIITPVFNIETFLNETIQSVVNQTYLYWELILIDDCSADSSPDIIRTWASKDQRIKPIFLNENVGAGNARNHGLDKAKGQYLAFLDSDDIWLEDKLRKQLDIFENNLNIECCFTWYTTIDENRNHLKKFITPARISENLLKFNNYILTSTFMCKTKSIEDIRFPSMRRRQDWAYFLEILSRTKYAYALPESTVFYRKIDGSLSANRWKLIKPNFDFFRETLYSGSNLMAFLHFILFLPFYFHNKLFNSKNLKN
ncbi:MAG: glycosyltransferase family 2 protein [Reichenbachiella sp.]|uniref:glycosyltransferase family 2 protein n=1 Tax=Reichenbachiella sp. TaxID=2184521 RepID=UPI003298431D